MRFIVCLCYLIICSQPTFAQIDSLKKILYKNNPDVLHKTRIYLDLSNAYMSEQLDSASFYTELAERWASKSKSKELIAAAMLQKASLYEVNNKINEASSLISEAKPYIEKGNFKKLKPKLYSFIGRFKKANIDTATYYFDLSNRSAQEIGEEKTVLDNKIRLALMLIHQKKHEPLAQLFNEIIPQLEKQKYYDGLAETYTYMSIAFRDLNDKDKSMLYANKAIESLKKVKSKKTLAFVYGALASGVVGYFEDFSKAEPLIQKSLDLAKQMNDTHFIQTTYKRLSILYYNNDETAKSKAIIDSFLKESNDPDVLRLKGLILTLGKKYNEANKYYRMAYDIYASESAYTQQKLTLQYKIDNKLEAHHDKELYDDFQVLDSLNEIIYQRESKNQFFEIETKYRTLEKEKELQKKQLDLEKSKSNLLIIAGIATLLLLSAIFTILFLRNKQRHKELLHRNNVIELQNHLNVKELQSLNNQLNPHEIKNLITSVAPELITKAPEAYRKMIKLLNLTRASLSSELTKSLDKQLKQAVDYLSLQQSISPYLWEFSLKNTCSNFEVKLPRLILKNIVENAVKYGMSTRKEKGQILIILKENKEDLLIEIKDNGLGEKVTLAESTGIGLSTYQKLFDFMNQHNPRPASISIERVQSWTSVNIVLPLTYKYQ